MKRMLINATQPEELRVALVDGQRLYDLDIENRSHEQKKANIYKGKIARVEPSLEACFVDYGAERHGFLPLKEISREYFTKSSGDQGRVRIQDVVKEGTEVIVQVDKEERGNKGAALTTFVSMAGRYLVLMPNNPRAGGISRRIEGDERNELREALRELEIPNGMGAIVRTAGIGRTTEELQWDLDYLLQLWTTIKTEADNSSAPHFLFQESNVIIRAIRDYLRPDIGEVIIDSREAYNLASAFVQQVMPSFHSKIKFYQDSIPLFNRYQIENQIETAFMREVKLPSGGSIVIDVTEALVSIDINSSRATKGGDIEETATQTNLEAAEEIARQLRLRDMGGLIVIDFIDMSAAKNQRDVENLMRKALEVDRARVQVGRISRFGLLEMSRQRLRPSLEETIFKICPRCSGQGTIRGTRSLALSILRLVEEEAQKEFSAEIRAITPVEVATFLLNEKRAEISDIEKRNKLRVLILPNPNMETPHYEVQRFRQQDEMVSVTSYKLTEEFAAEQPLEAIGPEVIPQAPQPAVQHLHHASPAPQGRPDVIPEAVAVPASGVVASVQTAKQPGLWQKLVAWFKAPEPVKEEETKPEVKAPANRNSRDGQRNNSRGRGQSGNNRRSGSGSSSQRNNRGDRDSSDRNERSDTNRANITKGDSNRVDTSRGESPRSDSTRSDAPRDDKRQDQRSGRRRDQNRSPRPPQELAEDQNNAALAATPEASADTEQVTSQSDLPPRRASDKRREPRRRRERQELPETLLPAIASLQIVSASPDELKDLASDAPEAATGVESPEATPQEPVEFAAQLAQDIEQFTTQGSPEISFSIEPEQQPPVYSEPAAEHQGTAEAEPNREDHSWPDTPAALFEAESSPAAIPQEPELGEQTEALDIQEHSAAPSTQATGQSTEYQPLPEQAAPASDLDESSEAAAIKEESPEATPWQAAEQEEVAVLEEATSTVEVAEVVDTAESAEKLPVAETVPAETVSAEEPSTQPQPESTEPFRAPNDPRRKPEPKRSVEIQSVVVETIVSPPLDTSLPPPVALANVSFQRPNNDPRSKSRTVATPNEQAVANDEPVNRMENS